MKLFLIASTDAKGGIGKNGTLPWCIKKELRFFQKMTTCTQYGHRIGLFMGRNTYESLPPSFNRKNRKLFVVSKRFGDMNGTVKKTVFPTIKECIEYGKHNLDALWCIGGSQIYKHCLENENILFDSLWITQIEKTYSCDTFFPVIPLKYTKVSSVIHGYDNTFLTFNRYVHKTDIERPILDKLFSGKTPYYMS